MNKIALCLIALVAVAMAADLLPIRATGVKRAPQDACSNNPCPSSETCCVTAGGEAGCCPAAGACCCPDQAHCCKSPYKCQCSGSCPGSGCSCTGCTQSGGSCESATSALEF